MSQATTTRPVARRGRRYTAADVAEARRLAEAGWRADKIAEIFNRRGIPVQPFTVKLWIEHRTAERHRRNQRKSAALLRAERSGGRLRGRFGSPWLVAVRVCALREELHLSEEKVAAVINFDLDLDLTAADVRRTVATGEPPRRLLKASS